MNALQGDVLYRMDVWGGCASRNLKKAAVAVGLEQKWAPRSRSGIRKTAP